MLVRVRIAHFGIHALPFLYSWNASRRFSRYELYFIYLFRPYLTLLKGRVYCSQALRAHCMLNILTTVSS